MPEELQFDRAIPETTASPVPHSSSAVCGSCQTSIDGEYYSVNGNTVCRHCRDQLDDFTTTPQGAGPFLLAAALGLGAGIIGAAIYYAVIALADLEIGIVAILIGYMVGWAVRKGAGGRGGRRFQVLATALTYGAVALAYTPLVFGAAIAKDEQSQKAATALTTSGTAATAPTASAASADRESPPSSRSLVAGLVLALGFIAALPVLMVVGSMPSGLISTAIIFFGMRQAWVMTGVPKLQISGPYRVGTAAPPSPPA